MRGTASTARSAALRTRRARRERDWPCPSRMAARNAPRNARNGTAPVEAARRARRRRAPSRRPRGPAGSAPRERSAAESGAGRRRRALARSRRPRRRPPPTLPAASRPCSSHAAPIPARDGNGAQGQADAAEREQPEPERHRVRKDDSRELFSAEPPARVEAIAHRRAREHREADVVGDRVRQKRGERNVDRSAGAGRCTRTRGSRSR